MRGFFFNYMKQALINISVQRLTNNIPLDLPAVVFGLNDFYSGYFDNIQRQLIQGLKIQSVTFGDPTISGTQTDFVCIRYNLPPHGFDKIYIRCNEIPYSSLLTSTSFNNFNILNIGYTVSDMNLASKQFIQNVVIQNVSLFGRQTLDSYTPNQFRNDMVKLNDFIELPVNMKIDADKSFNTKMVYSGIPLSSQTMNLSLTIVK